MSNDKQSKPSKPRKPKPKRRVKSDGEVRRAAVARASAAARQLAAVILQVLAGELGTYEAAAALGKSPAQYYKLEVRALEGLLQGCEPRSRGRQPSPERELARLQAANARLERECTRLQSLVRLLGKTSAKGAKRGAKSTQKGASGSRKAPRTGSGKAKTGRTRKRTIRALRLAAQMTDHVDEQPPSEQGSEPPKQAQPKVNGGTSWRDR